MRAIILAAGMGTRLRPVTNDTPKSLVSVNGTPMAEKQVQYLIEKGINEIIIVTGYLHEKFNYLVEKYGVKIIYNENYDKFNNVYTMYLVREFLSDAYVLEGDVYMDRNFIDPEINQSAYFGVRRGTYENEWYLGADENQILQEIKVQSGGNDPIIAGISYWSKEDGEYIKGKLEEVISSGDFTDLYWDDIVRLNIKNMNVKLIEIDSTDCYEIDTVKELEEVEKKLSKRIASPIK